MKTIYKYVLSLVENPALDMPRGARVLDVQIQNNEICLWAIVESTEKLETRKFFIAGTGNPVPQGAGDYIGTVQQDRFVWHVFEEREPGPEYW